MRGAILARLHEFQGKALLKQGGISIPEGKPAYSPEEVREIAEELNQSVVIKAQAWTTSRLAKGLIQFADTPEEAFRKAKELFGKTVDNFPTEVLLVEKRLKLEKEYYGGIIINDSQKKPEIIFSSKGGSGIEEIALKFPKHVARMQIDVVEGLKDYHARNLVSRTGLHGSEQNKIAALLVKLWNIARKYEARSAEINPIVLTKEGEFQRVECLMNKDSVGIYLNMENQST